MAGRGTGDPVIRSARWSAGRAAEFVWASESTTMADSLAELFEAGEDINLCDRLFVRICEVHGNGADASSLSEEERTVYLVWGTLGVVGNGGFRYLFESDVPGDPDYALTRKAFETIGCREAAGALSQALAAFPGDRRP